QNSPMTFAAELCADQFRDEWRRSPQLRMAEGVLRARGREELTVWSFDSFRYGNDAVVVSIQSVLHLGQEPHLVERDLGKQQDVWTIAFLDSGERASGGPPAGMPAHHFQCEHLGRGAAHCRQVESRLANRGRDVFRQ